MDKQRGLRLGGQVFLWWMFLALPLALHNGYFDITETKTAVFVTGAAAYLFLHLVLALQFGAAWEKPTAAEGCLLLLALIALLSSVLSGFFRDSFVGAQGRWQGAGMLLLYALLYGAIRRAGWSERDILPPLLAGFLLTGLLAVVNHQGADPLGLSLRLREADQGRYISTLGNINFAGAYFTALLPVAVCRLLLSEKRSERLFLAGASLLGLWAVMAARSESSILGLAAALALLPLLLRASPRALRRWPWLLPALAGGMQLYGLLCSLSGAYLSALTRFLLRPALSLSLALVGILLGLLLRRKEPAALRRFWRCYGAALLLTLGLGIALLALLNTRWRGVSLGRLENYLRFSSAWGTDRGAIWGRCLAYYRDFPPIQKLLGGGCGILPRLDRADRLFPDAVLDTAHCEYLQLLLNWGVLGLCACLGWLLCAAASVLRRGEPAQLSLLAGALSYAAQAWVNIAQAPSVCVFVLLLSLASAGMGTKRDFSCHEH